MAQLKIIRGRDVGRTVTVDREVFLGRDEDNGLRLLDETSSRRHAKIQRLEDRHVLYDLDSNNGTFVNGERVRERLLRDGDQILIGITTILFEEDGVRRAITVTLADESPPVLVEGSLPTDAPIEPSQDYGRLRKLYDIATLLGASLEAAEAVCGATVDTLSSLVDDHLVQRVDADEQTRFGMLETIREYALDLLGERRPAVEEAMAMWLAELVDAVELESRVSGHVFSQLDPEIDNLRVALESCTARGDVELELRLAGGLWRYCWVRGIAPEGLRRIESALAARDERPTAARARALQGGAGLAWSLGDFEHAKDLARAAIPVAAEAGSLWDEMAANTVLGVVANNEDDREAARFHHRRSMELSEQLGLEPLAQKINLGVVAMDTGEYEEARGLFEDVLALQRRNENVQGIGFAMINLGVVQYALGDHAASLEAFREARDRFEEVGFRAHVAHAVQGFAAYEASEGRFEEAAWMLGQARAVLDEVGSSETDFAVDMVAWTKQKARAALGDEAFAAAYAGGRESQV